MLKASNFFVKSHGLGNEYIVLDQSNLNFELSTEIIRKLCNVHYGLGSDGILLKVDSKKADFGLKIYNPDGSEAEKSGNGLRIFSKYLFDYSLTNNEVFTVETPGGTVVCKIIETKNNKAWLVEVEMGPAIFETKQIPVNIDLSSCIDYPLQINNQLFYINTVSVGNPHCTILTDNLEEDSVRQWGPQIENHLLFPNKINVQFVKVLNRHEAQILIWERGAGFTLASGSSSSAVSAILVKKGLCDSPVTISMPGGRLILKISPDFHITMTGEVQQIAEGNLSDELFF